MSEVITDNLDLWSSALLAKSTAGRGSNGKLEAYGIKKLRALILELAVRGKLVPQDTNDEPARVLLERIEKEKARLIQEGLIKKEKSLPEISDDEKSFLLPNGWEWSRLQDVSSYVQRGKGPRYADFGKVQVVSQKSIQWAGFDLSQARPVDDASLDGYQSERFLRKDDLLWNSTGTGTAGRINVVPEVESNSLVADSHVTIIRPLMVSSSFLSCYVAAPGIQQRIEPGHENPLVSGTTNQVELNLSAVVQLVVPIPPFIEQHRIVAKVDELMALCDQLEQRQTHSIEAHQTLVESLLSTLTNVETPQELTEAWTRIAHHFDTLFTTDHSIEQIKQTILQLAVMGKLVSQDPNDEPASVLLERIKEAREKLIRDGKIKRVKALPEISDYEKIFVLPAHWSWTRLGDYAVVLSGNAFSSEDFNNEGGAKVAKITNAGVGEFVETNDFLPLEFIEKYKNFIVEEDDLIFALTRPYISDGLKISKCPGSYHKALLNQRVAAIRTSANIDFLYAYMQSRFVLSVYKDRFGSSGLQPNLKVSDVTSLLVPVPPENEQHRIVAKVDELMALCDVLKARLAEAHTTQIRLADAIVEQAVA